MKQIVLSTLIAAAAWAVLAAPAQADEESDLAKMTNRYQLLSGTVNDKPGTLMVDSASGRTWVLETDDAVGGLSWRRIPVKMFAVTPQGYLARPNPVNPKKGPAPAAK
ncbi:hypothetical protein JCM17960_01500 [Magnetospira thiophila]